MKQTSENNKKPNFGPNFGLFGSHLGPKNVFGGFYHTSPYTLFQSIILCNLKKN